MTGTDTRFELAERIERELAQERKDAAYRAYIARFVLRQMAAGQGAPKGGDRENS